MFRIFGFAIILFLFGCGENEQERKKKLDIEFDNCIQSAKDSVSDLCGNDKECTEKYFPEYRKSCLIEKFGCSAVTGNDNC